MLRREQRAYSRLETWMETLERVMNIPATDTRIMVMVDVDGRRTTLYDVLQSGDVSQLLKYNRAVAAGFAPRLIWVES